MSWDIDSVDIVESFTKLLVGNVLCVGSGCGGNQEEEHCKHTIKEMEFMRKLITGLTNRYYYKTLKL